MDNVIIKGARENNLKNINLEIPRDRLVVFTGVSGSGRTVFAHFINRGLPDLDYYPE